MKLKRDLQLTIIANLSLIFGVMMFGYWIAYMIREMPLQGIPLFSEIVNACLAIFTAIAILKMKPWALHVILLTAGMWMYGVIGGINMVIMEGLNFDSPMTAKGDTIVFFIVLGFSIYMAIVLWKKRKIFYRTMEHLAHARYKK